MNCFLIYRRQLNLLLFAYKSAALQKLSFPVIKIVFSAGVENASKLKLDPLFATTPRQASPPLINHRHFEVGPQG